VNFRRNDVVRPILPEAMDRYRASQESAGPRADAGLNRV
jgi:hypothetical protein